MSETPRPSGPILIDLDDTDTLSPAEAPPVPDAGAPLPDGAAMQTVAALAARRGSALGRWFWRLLTALVSFGVGLAFWRFVEGLVTSNPLLGWIALALTAAFVLVCVAIVIRELMALARLGRLDRLHDQVRDARARGDLSAARKAADRVEAFYRGRDDLAQPLATLKSRRDEVLDADGLFDLTERELMAPLDLAARAEVQAASRQVAMVTAIVPLALADVFAALTANLRMIRRIAEIYGGRSGTLETWRLTRMVMTHLVATGAVAVGDDLLGGIGGGHLLSKLSRRFGEGMVNGALTARVGIAAMEVCRPLPFEALPRPSVTRLVKRALTGLFDSGSADGKA